ILESSLYSDNVTFAAIVDAHGVAVAHVDPALEGTAMTVVEPLDSLLNKSALQQLAAIFSGQGRNLEVRQPLLLDGRDYGSIRIGVSTLLIRNELNKSLGPAVATAFAALAIAVIVAMLLSQLMLRPIHVIRSGLTRLGRGEFGVRLELDQDDEFGELGSFFNTVSAQLSADRSQMAGQVANLESAVGRLGDGVAIVSPKGELLFANPAMRELLPERGKASGWDALVPEGHPLRRLADETLSSRQSRGPMAVHWPWPVTPGGRSGKRPEVTDP